MSNDYEVTGFTSDEGTVCVRCAHGIVMGDGFESEAAPIFRNGGAKAVWDSQPFCHNCGEAIPAPLSFEAVWNEVTFDIDFRTRSQYLPPHLDYNSDDYGPSHEEALKLADRLEREIDNLTHLIRALRDPWTAVGKEQQKPR